MTKQLSLFEAIEEEKSEFDFEGVQKEVKNVVPSAAIVCNSCGSKMKFMGPQGKDTKTVEVDGEEIEWTVGTWMYSCRNCRHGSVKAVVNPLVKRHWKEPDTLVNLREALGMEKPTADRVEFEDGVGEKHAIVSRENLMTEEIDGTEYTYHEDYYKSDYYE